jgi:SAM-dependent methyltransferase
MTLSFADVWNTILAPKFVRFRRVLVEGAAPHGRRALDLVPPRPGGRALDVGCGFGDGTVDLAERAGPSGTVTGVDVVSEFIDLSRRTVLETRATNVAFEVADAERFSTPERYDYVFSRFGTMFFERPGAAFRNLRRLLAPEGRLVMTTWRGLAENPWLAVGKSIAREHLGVPEDRSVSCGPGPFSLAAPDTVTELLTASGFRRVRFEPSEAPALVGATVEEAVEFQLAIGPAGEIVREAGPRPESVMSALRGALGAAMLPYATPSGVFMPSAAWVVKAEA